VHVNNIIIEPNAVFEGETKIVSGRVHQNTTNGYTNVDVVQPKKLGY